MSAALAAAALFGLAPTPARALEVQGYGFEAAAQELTQLFWLAETASACGWASADDIEQFKLFSLRFLAAHLSDRNRLALYRGVRTFTESVRKAAFEGRPICSSNRWRLGWSSCKSAADKHATDF
jgi:hypothetical protein